MANSYGNYNQTKDNKLASGIVHDASLRMYEKIFDLSADADPAGGTPNVLVGPRVREGSKVTHFTIGTTANLSGVTLKAGSLGDDAKYAAAAAGPNAVTQVVHVLPATGAGAPLSDPEDFLLTPSGNLPATGKVVLRVFASHR